MVCHDSQTADRLKKREQVTAGAYLTAYCPLSAYLQGAYTQQSEITCRPREEVGARENGKRSWILGRCRPMLPKSGQRRLGAVARETNGPRNQGKREEEKKISNFFPPSLFLSASGTGGTRKHLGGKFMTTVGGPNMRFERLRGSRSQEHGPLCGARSREGKMKSASPEARRV